VASRARRVESMPTRADSCGSCGWEPAEGGKWPSEGGRACWWIERYCICGEGDWYGRLIRLRPDQRLSLWRWYEYCGGCGRWRYNHWVRTEATGGGKTTFMAAVEVLELAGPPEISCVSPVVTSAANSWDQANKLFGAASIMCGGQEGHKVDESPLKGYFEVYDSKITRTDGRPGELNRVAAVAGTNEGGLPSTFVCDEGHELGEEGQTRARMHVVIGKSTNKRQLRCRIPLAAPEFTGPGELAEERDSKGNVRWFREIRRGPGRIIDISTAGFDVKHSFFGGMYLNGKKALKNPAVAPRLLFECWEAPPGLNFEKEEDRLTAVLAASPAAGILWDPMDRVNEWTDPKMPHTDWGRYYGNRWETVAADSWLKDHPGAWGACKGTWTLADTEPTVLAVDMALKRDTVAVVEVARLLDGRPAATARIWEPVDRKVSHLDVYRYIRDRARALGPRFHGLVYDSRYFELPAEMLEDEEGVLVIEFSQSPEQMVPAVRKAFDAIVAGDLVQDGDEDFARQVESAVKREQEGGFTLSKRKSAMHIDAAVALCMGVYALDELAPVVDPLQTMW
jgi:phage terminase large subunit-like protein